ncbi:MAG: hypothetical protein WCO09_01150 [bacterium]
MSKNTIIKIGLAGGLYNLVSLFLISLAAEMHISFFGRIYMSLMQKYGPLGYNLSFGGMVSGCIWALVAGFIQFGAIALIFNILSTNNLITSTVSKWIRSSKK